MGTSDGLMMLAPLDASSEDPDAEDLDG